MVLRPGIAPSLAILASQFLLVLGLAGAPTPALAADPCSAVARTNLTLGDPQGGPAEDVPALGVLACLDPEGSPLAVLSPSGRPALLPRPQALVVREEPAQVRQRLARLERAGLGTETCLRVLEGRIQENDSPWLVEMAWGPPQRRFMVNLFYDEEHFVYLRPGQEPLLLRFKGGRLGGQLGPPPPATSAPPTPAPVERVTTPR